MALTTEIDDLVGDQVNNPSLPPGTVQQPVLLEEQPDEFLDPTAGQITSPVQPATAATPQFTPMEQVTTDLTAAQGPEQQQFDTATYEAATSLDQLNQEGDLAQAAQGTVDPNSLVRTQYEQLTDFGPGEVPDWAKGAVFEAEARMLERGLSSSTMAGTAVAEAILKSALPIAQQDAATYGRMNEMNLNNRQQVALFNAQSRLQAILSDTAQVNAARQFNAQSENQLQSFFAQLNTSVADMNARRMDAMTQLQAQLEQATNAINANNQKEMEIARANLDTTISKFNAELNEARERFNAENALLVEQSNVVWRRQINTVNTATQNAINQTNAQNLYNLSSWSMASLWQAWRDEAAWAWTSSENDADRAQNLALASLQRSTTFDILDQQAEAQLFQAMGRFSLNLLNGLLD